MLTYDNAAFYIFFITILLVYLVPATIYVVQKCLCHGVGREKSELTHARTKAEQITIKKIEIAKRRKNPLKHPCYLIHWTIILILWWGVLWSVSQLESDGEIEQFDPYKILGVDKGADVKAIQKAFRKQSLIFHPDKNPGDGQAAEKFIMVKRAKEALTDDEARANYEKWGNPDGRQSMAVSIGLPTFLLEKEHHVNILLFYLMVLVVVIPLCVWCWYSNSKQYGQKNVMESTYRSYAFSLQQETSLKMLPEIFCASQEFAKLPVVASTEATKEMFDYAKKFQREKLMAKPRHFTFKKAQSSPKCAIPFGNNVLLHAHLLGLPLCEKNQLIVDGMLEKMPRLVEAMVFMSTLVGQRMWTSTAIQVIHFGQMLTQGLWIKSSPLQQLPGFGEREAGHASKGKKTSVTMRSFIEKESERKGMGDFTGEMIKEVDIVSKIIPIIDVSVKCIVTDEEEIAEGDLVTLHVKLIRKNMEDDAETPPVYAPRCPVQRKDSYWVMFLCPDATRLIAITKVSGHTKELNTEIKFRAPSSAGTYLFEVQVLPDSYMGCDEKVKFNMKVVPLSTLPVYKPHPDDESLYNEPTIFGDIQGGYVNEDTDSESEEEEEVSKLTEAQRRRRKLRQRKKQKQTESDEDTDTDSDSDGANNKKDN